jgi:hypothetical protein
VLASPRLNLQLLKLQNFDFNADPPDLAPDFHSHAEADLYPGPASPNNENPCGSGSATLLVKTPNPDNALILLGTVTVL